MFTKYLQLNMKKILYIFLATILFVGCCSPKEIIREVPIEVTHDVYHNIYIHDTTHVTDSSVTYIQGDTVFKEKYKYIYTERQVHDTLATHDTIPQPFYITQTKTVKEPQWWPVWLMLGAIIAGFIIYIVLKFKTKFISIFKIFK